MPVNNQLYKSIVPINNDATRTYSRERIERINADKLYVTIGGKKVLKSSLNQREQFISKPTNTTESKQSKDLAEDKIATKERLEKFAEQERIDKERELKVAPYAAMGLVGTLTGTLPAMIGGEIGGRSVDYASEKLTGKSFGENLLPEAPAIGSLFNPGYVVGGLVGQYRNTLGKNIYKINPLSEKLNNRNSSYRVVSKPQIKNNLNEVGNIFKTDKIDADYGKDIFKSYTRPKTSNEDAFNVLGDFRERIATKEGRERMKALGITDDEIFKKLKIVDDNTTFGSYQDQTNTIGLHPEHPLVRKVVRHETEHAVQNAVSLSKLNKYNTDAGNLKYFFRPKYGKQILKDARSGLTDIDKELSSLELRKEPTPNIKFAAGKASSKAVDISRYKDLVANKQHATDYFTYGSGGREKSSFLSEVQQYMMDQNIIPKTSYVKIDENMVEQTFMDAMFDEKNGGKYLRLFNIMKPTDSNYKLVASLLNKMLSTGTVVTVASTTSNKNK